MSIPVWLKGAQRSLQRSFLIWILTVFVAWLLIDAWLGYQDALRAANQAFDRSLSVSVKGIAERISVENKALTVDIPYSSFEFFEAGSNERIFYRIGLPNAPMLTGYEDLPQPTQAVPLNTLIFYDGTYKGAPVRLAALSHPLYHDDFPDPVQVIFAETIHSRQGLWISLFLRQMGRQLILLISLLVLALWSMRRVFRPLETLGAHLGKRAEDDLTPLETDDIPLEVLPLVDAINAHMRRIERMLLARRRFITDAAHQLRTPLAVLSTQAEYALRQHQVEEIRPAVKALQQSLGGAIRLTNQMLSLSRAEPVNGLAEQYQTLDIRLLAQEVVLSLWPLAEQKQIDLGITDETVSAWVHGNSLLLREMLTNLIDNALRYTPSGGGVTVSIQTSQAKEIHLQIWDTGPGIPKAERERVFLRFFRLNPQDSFGSGLGLAIVREIVLAHGGRIHLEDAPVGTGLNVFIFLPQVQAPK